MMGTYMLLIWLLLAYIAITHAHQQIFYGARMGYLWKVQRPAPTGGVGVSPGCR